MDKKDFNNKPVTEEDYDLFYGFVDSVFEGKKQLEEGNQDPSAALTESEWTAEPFEEFIIGLPQPDNGKYYSLNIISPDLAPSPVNDIHPNHYGTISGMILSITISIALIFSLYFFTTADQAPEEGLVNLHNIENKLNGIETKIIVAENIDVQMQAMMSQLHKLNMLIASSQQRPSATSEPEVSEPAAPEPITILPIATTPAAPEVVSNSLDSTLSGWVINLASVRGNLGVDQLLAQIKALGIPAESFTTYIKGKEWTRIRVAGFSNREIAVQAMQELPANNIFSHSWVGPQ